MKSRMFVTLSMVANVVLALMVGWLLSRRPADSTATTLEATQSAGATRVQTAHKTNVIEKVTTDVVKVDWRMVESENYKQYIVNLRAIGCPEETIRDIIVADVNKLFESRRKEFFPATNKFEYWKGGNFFTTLFDEKKMEKQEALNAEKRALLKELLGVDVADKTDLISGTKVFETMLDFLPAAKQTELMEFEQKFAAKSAKYMKDIQRGDPEALKKLMAEKDAELLKILSPDEKFEYDLRMSQSAMVMRMQMGDLEVSEQEFRDLFKLRKQFDDEHGLAGMAANRGEDRDKRALAQKELDAQTRQVMGDDRFLDYRFSADYERSSLKKIAEQHNIPKANALKVFEIRNIAQEEASRLRGDQSLSPEELQERLNNARTITEGGVRDLIGQPALDAYIKDGSWLKNLNRASGGN
jgi:hypothetical protein